MTPKQAQRLDDEALVAAIADTDNEIGARGEQIASLRKEQRKFLEQKDILVLEQTARIRSTAAQTLGDTDG